MPSRQPEWWENLVNYVARPLTDIWSAGSAEALWSTLWRNYQEGKDKEVEGLLFSANQDPMGTLGNIAQSGHSVTPEVEKWLDNLISQQNTKDAQDFSIYQSQNDLLNAASQLQQLGLSASGVLQTGGSQMNGVAAAENVKTNIAQQRYAQRMAIAKQLLGMTSQMASAGVYGNAFASAKKASAILSAQAANSARLVTRYDANDHRVGRTLTETLPEDFDYSRLF